MKTKKFVNVKVTVLYLSIIFASGLFMVTIYNTIVDSKSWGGDLPTSIQTARDYYKIVDPRNFFQIIAPINQLLISLTIVLFWKDSIRLRYYFVISFLFYAIIFALTIFYFVPRDLILFTSKPIEQHMDQIKKVLVEWQNMNWLRSFLGLTGILFSFKGLDSYYKIRQFNINI
ncbi:DUF1772 domain-containing protein [Galbibacter pacificus]|uniref:DUF1772 domain-containing protein n=1 Tax=Galbibacter pacificus TaxID=2996052 RepID=A0ABT6FQY0_9FLAO|nr:DUF1772 domain-containing protein [Galbibacter pacificus]MDG3581847.1 DUF1772 domain-containing protein [Galbibacter pacificus]MDG3585679.1 DUF1772 domain-containing protein [Galbibacter pacificus]